jgi:quinoprotein glucose dehydrogenase
MSPLDQRLLRRRWLRRFAFAAALLALSAQPLYLAPTWNTPAPSPSAPPAEWVRTDGDGGAHASPLADITAATVDRLEVAWTYRTGDVSDGSRGTAGTAFQATPIMVDGTLYVSTPFSRVVALDAETGAERWSFDPGVDRSDKGHKMVTTRGVATWLDPERNDGDACRRRILAVSYDARLSALDARTGRPCGDFGAGGQVHLLRGVARIEGREDQFRHTSAPTVVHDLVVVGSTIFDNLEADAPSGVVRAFDVRTGALRWSFEPLTGVGGFDAGGAWVPAGAANTWVTITPDEERDLLFVPTGSASPDHYGGLRPGDNAYANSIVALRASTGEVVWHRQLVHHDLWDYDLATPPALITVERAGERVAAVVQATKMGYLFVFDRETGEPLFPIEERPVPASDVPGEVVSPTQPVPLLPRQLAEPGMTPDDAWGLTAIDRAACRRKVEGLRHDGVYAPPSVRGTVSLPGFLGGMEWGGVAYAEDQGILVVNTNHLAMVATLIPRAGMAATAVATGATKSLGPQERTPYGVTREPLLSPLKIPCNRPPWGTLAGVDMRTGDVRWEVPLGTMRDLLGVPTPPRWGSPNLGGPVVAGGLAFIGATMDRTFRAFDVATGRLVWETELPASAQATPMTYRTRPGGRQFVVIAAGGHYGLRSALGDYVIAYALPEPPVVAAEEER